MRKSSSVKNSNFEAVEREEIDPDTIVDDSHLEGDDLGILDEEF